MSTRSGRVRPSIIEASPPRTRKGVSPPRSPGRPRNVSPPTQTSRKSPSRKSPSRKPASKFPARKSPSRTTKEATETATQKSPGKRLSSKTDIAAKLQEFTKLSDVYRGTRTRRSDYSIKDPVASQVIVPDDDEVVNGIDSSESTGAYGLRNRKSVEEIIPRRSGRLREVVENIPVRRSHSKSASKSVSESVSQSLTFSDDDNSEEELLRKKSESSRKLATPLRESVSRLAQLGSRWEFGGRIGSALLIPLIPLVVFSIILSCSRQTCSPKYLIDLSALKQIAVFRIWFSWQTLAIISAQTIVQAILAFVPILGTKADRMDEYGRKDYFNAFFCSTVTIFGFFTFVFNIYDSTKILSDYLRLATASYIFAVILSIVLYVKSRKMDDSELNPYGNTGYALYDFCLGREIHPYIGKLDVKLWLSRITNINALALAVLIWVQEIFLPAIATNAENYKEFFGKVNVNTTILVYTIMQILYLLYFIMREYKITSTFFWQSEGLGYIQIVSSALYPFYFTSILKYIADTKSSLTTIALIGASVLYLLGFSLMSLSNNLKHEFRINPLHHSFANLYTMPTFHGKKLLVSSTWGFLRHPNYTGDILIHIAFSIPGLVSGHYMAAAPALITILILVHRALRDNARCRRRYGAAWERYCKRVPSIIIPKVL